MLATVLFVQGAGDMHLPELDAYRERLPRATARRIPGREHAFVQGLPELVEDIRRVVTDVSVQRPR